jgi:ectoine hydroxylase-related dioxygenase (phytanoyl-CoA dioxygenase family)
MIIHNAHDWNDIGNCRELNADLFRDGFVSLNHIADADDIRTIRTEILGLLTDRSVEEHKIRNLGDAATAVRDGTIFEIVSPSTLRPRLLESLFFQRALQISRTILGSSARLRFDHCITKLPHNVTATAWHQDGAYQRLTRSPRRLHWWLPLQDVNMDNGCMQFVPSSHVGPVLPHAPRSAGAHALKTNLPVDAVPVACPLDVGGATIHLPKTLHYTGPNNTDAARHAWIVQIGIWGWIPTFLH